MQARPDERVGAIAIAREGAGASLFSLGTVGHKGNEVNRTASRKSAEELAKRKGVDLVPSPSRVVPPAAPSRGSLAKVMPAGAQLMADMKAQLPPEIYQAALDNLKRGAGYVVDLAAGIAVGLPPIDRFECGRVQEHTGLPLRRVRPRRGPQEVTDAGSEPR